MTSKVLENYRLLQEKFKAQEFGMYLNALRIDIPSVKIKAINYLSKREEDIPEIKELIEDADPSVRLAAFKYSCVKGYVDCETIKKLLKDTNSSVRKEAINRFFEYGCDDAKNLVFFSKDPDPNVRFHFINKFFEFLPEEVDTLQEHFSNDPDPRIKAFLTYKDNISDLLLDPNIPLNIKKSALMRYKEANDFYTIFNTVKENYDNLPSDVRKLLINILSTIPCDIVKSFLTQKLEDEIIELKVDISKVLLKICGPDELPSWVIDELLDSNIPEYKSIAFKFAATKEDMSYVDLARELIDKSDDKLLPSIIDYLLKFHDYFLLDKVEELMNSVSLKRKTLALKIIKILKLDSFAHYVAQFAENKSNSLTLRKNALNTLKSLKITQYWEVPFNILKDKNSPPALKSVALTTLMKLNPEAIITYIEEQES